MFKNGLLSTSSWAALLTAVGGVGAANATPFVAGQTITPGSSLSQAGTATYNGQFNINSFLPSGTNIGDVQAVSAYVTAYGYSAVDAQLTDSYTPYSYNYSYSYTYQTGGGYGGGYCGTWGCYYYYVPATYATGYVNYYLRDHTQTTQDLVDDTMLLTVGGQNAQEATSQNSGSQETHDSGYNGITYVSASYSTNTTNYYQQREYTQTDEYYGPLAIGFALDAANLTDLGTDGILDFQISALAGQFSLNQISITANFQTVSSASAVDEPWSGGVLGGGLAMWFACAMNRRRKARKAVA